MDDRYLIKSKSDLRSCIEKDKIACIGKKKICIEDVLRKPFKVKLYRFFKLLRKYEYMCFLRDNSTMFLASKLMSFRIKLCDARKNRLSLLLQVEINPFCCDSSVRICHPNVIINGFVKDGCVFHGNNVIGNKKTGEKNMVPHIGKNVDIGIGAIVIGDVEIADNCVIGAGAVVTKSFTVPGTVIAGVPAKKIN